MMRLWPSVAVGLSAAIIFLSSAIAEDLPDCAGPVEIGRINVIRVEKNAALILADGRAVHLEGIRLPQGAADHAPQFLADQALATLWQLVDGRTLTVTALPPKEDRYDRVRGQAFADGDWLQIEMVRRGLARVAIAPDRVDCAAELYTAESKARDQRAGIWSSSAYAVRGTDNLAADVGTFQIVQGKVLAADIRDGQGTLDFGGDIKSAFIGIISPSDMKVFRMIGVDPHGYSGKTVRVRGIVQRTNGPAIAIANPAEVEVVRP